MKLIKILRIKGLFALLYASLTLYSCKNMLDVESSRAVAEDNMWNSIEDTRAGLMGVYGLTRAALVDNNAHWLYGEVRAGEFYSPSRGELRAIYNNELTSSYSILESLSNWTNWYAIINAANLFLEHVNDVYTNDPQYTENNMNVDIAQVRCLRAFAYFYMVRIWGDVPFITSSNEIAFAAKPREDQNKILAWAQNEITEAIPYLPYEYSSNNDEQEGDYYNEPASQWAGSLVRKLSAYAILAHIAAWQGNYSDVANYTGFILNNYSKSSASFNSSSFLYSSTGLFFDNNSDQLLGFSFGWSDLEASVKGHIEELTLAKPYNTKAVPEMYIPKDKIIQIFNEDKDDRFYLDTLGTAGNENYFVNFATKYPVFSKIKCNYGGSTDVAEFTSYSSALVFTRMEDIALLRAEALYALGDNSGAITELDKVRTSRALDNYEESVNGDLLDAIFKERQRELMGEGHRWYDMVRYAKLRSSDISPLLNNGGIYWPIASSVLAQNDLLVQNDYWK